MITKRELAIEIAKLGLVFPKRSDMTESDIEGLCVIYFEDLGGLSKGELMAACSRYRKHPDSRFFPTPGQLLALVD